MIRGETIGLVGNTGTSVAPHLHYEVSKDGKKANPAHYYFNDLTPAQYEILLQNAEVAHQSFDYIATGLVLGRRPNQRDLPAFPETNN